MEGSFGLLAGTEPRLLARQVHNDRIGIANQNQPDAN
jgi:hypothetical protein